MKKSMLSTKQSYLMCAVGIVVLFGILMGVPADIQGRAGLGRDDRHSRRFAGNRLWAAGAVFCCGRYENLRGVFI